MRTRCPIEPGTRVRVVSGPYRSLVGDAPVTVQRVQPSGGHLRAAWLLTCRTERGQPVPVLIDEVEVCDD